MTKYTQSHSWGRGMAHVHFPENLQFYIWYNEVSWVRSGYVFVVFGISNYRPHAIPLSIRQKPFYDPYTLDICMATNFSNCAWQGLPRSFKTAAVLQCQIQLHLYEINCMYFDLEFTELCLLGPIWQYISIAWFNGVAPNRRQPITWGPSQ